MNKLKQIISETLQNYQVVDSCKSCNTPPLLVESKQYDMAISEAMRYHIDSQIQLTENIYRPGSFAHQKLLTEARILWSKGIIELQGTDKKLYENTNIGRWAKYEGEFVPLDLPLMEIETQSELPDTYKGNDDIIFTKVNINTRVDGQPSTHYKLTWKGHDIDPGGYNFSNFKELQKFASDYILSNQIYNKLRYEDPITEAEYHGKEVS